MLAYNVKLPFCGVRKFSQTKRLRFLLLCLILVSVFGTGALYMQITTDDSIRCASTAAVSDIIDVVILGVLTLYEMIYRSMGGFGETPYDETLLNYPMSLNATQVETIITGKQINSLQPLYVHHHKPLISPRKVCVGSKDSNTPLLILIKSANQNQERRSAIRNSWGNERLFPFIRRVFLIGINEGSTVQITKEAEMFDDIVQYDFIDAYRNNTLKTISGFNWASKHCKGFKFAVFVDDDYLVFIHNFKKYLFKLMNLSIEPKNIFVGAIIAVDIPHRASFHRWSVPVSDYPYPQFPPSVSAGTMLFSWDALEKITRLIPYTKPIHLDDIYVGILAKRLGIKPIDCPYIANTKVTDSRIDYIIASHGYRCPAEMVQIWKKHSNRT